MKIEFQKDQFPCIKGIDMMPGILYKVMASKDRSFEVGGVVMICPHGRVINFLPNEGRIATYAKENARIGLTDMTVTQFTGSITLSN